MHTLREAGAFRLAVRSCLAVGQLGRAVRAALMHAGALVLLWQTRARDRDILGGLSERTLRDVGLSRADVEHESRKPFWQP